MAEPLPETELRQDVETLDVIDVEVAEEQKDRFSAVEMTVRPVDAVSGVENDVVPLRLHEGADRVSRLRIVPAVRAQKDDLHLRPPQEFSGNNIPFLCLSIYPLSFALQPFSPDFSDL